VYEEFNLIFMCPVYRVNVHFEGGILSIALEAEAIAFGSFNFLHSVIIGVVDAVVFYMALQRGVYG
ncbi:hypothetical protein HAX54_011003, partial [Datura stramonium]|nr:hypothetical protein [Datura stramonium]